MNSRDPLSSHFILLGPERETARVAPCLQQADWTCALVALPSQALVQARENRADALIVAPGDPPRDYLEFCRTLKLQSHPSRLPVVFILTPEMTEIRVRVYQAGADDCICLPASHDEIALRLLKAIRSRRESDSYENAATIITALANAIEGKDSYTCGHVERVATYSLELGRTLSLTPSELATLKIGAMLHDIGKVTVPDHILNKPGPLTAEEMEIIKRHPQVGDEILKSMTTFQEVRPIVRWHHERPNGTGYPDGVGGSDLPLLPRIVAVADYFDALNSARPYRAALPLDKCQTILEEAAEKGDLDADLVRALLSIVGREVALELAGSET